MTADTPSNEAKLALLRVQLFTAMQQLAGDELSQFWNIVDDINACRPAEITRNQDNQPVNFDADRIIKLIMGACQSRGLEPMTVLNLILQLTGAIGAALSADTGRQLPWLTALDEAACRLVLAAPEQAR